MINRFLLLLSFLLVMIIVLVQPVKSQDNHLNDLLNQYKKSKPDTTRVRLLLELSQFYLLKPNELSIDLDSALMLGEEAKLLSRDLKFKQGEEKADYMMGWINVEAKNYSALTSQMKMFGDTTRIRVMLKFAEYKWGTQGNTKEVQDSAIYYSSKALEHARALRSVMLEIQARFSLAGYTHEKLEFESLKPLLIEGLKSCRNAVLTEDLSQILLLALLTFGTDDQQYAEIKSIWKTTLDDSKNAAETKCMQDATQELLEKSSIINFNVAMAYNFENADRFYFRLVDFFGKTAEQSPLVYGSLCYVYFMKGDLIQCLYNGIKAEKLAEKDNARLLPHLTYNLIGQAYFRMGNIDECINYMQKAVALLRSRHITPDGGVIKYLTRAYVAKNKQQEALAFLDESTKNGKYVNHDLKDLLESKGIVYQSLGQYDKA
ncbi:MAG TPA: tetratricopeptide repeat protein, partial [Chitinophagaceae bacterium]|nr:tetratricopeptide repeat protein [Chitinophagaceae bacterium]